MQPGTVLEGRFAMETIAAGGGMAVVYRARDSSTGKKVAIKIARETSLDPIALQRFEQEVGVLQSLDHPAIVRLVGHGTTADGKPYLAMEWLEGEELQRRMRQEPIAFDDAVALGKTVATALAVAHDAGVVHRDVKPANVFLVDGNPRTPKLLDFGVARVLAAPGATQTGVTVGTPRYMAPEQARGDREISARADTFSLGCVLYECFTGARAFEGQDMLAVLARILLEDPTPPRSVVPTLPAAIETLLLSMLAKEPAARPDMRRVVAALEAEDVASSRRSISVPRPVESRPQITEAEVGIVCVLLVRGGRAAASDETLLDSDTVVRKDHIHHALARFEASVETLADGSVVAAFSRRGSARDQASLAARAALALRAVLPERGVAVATGRSVVKERLPIGEALDRVAEIGQRVRPGHVHIDTLTAALLDERFEIIRGEDIELVAEVERGMETRRLLGRPTPFVGRNRELRLLESGFDECEEQGAARAVLITGPAGTGKSRLRHELLSVLSVRPSPPHVWIGRGDPTRTASPGYVLADALRRAFGLATGVARAAAQERIRGRVRPRFPADVAARVTLFLAELLGAPFETTDPEGDAEQQAFRVLQTARRDAVVLGDQFRRAAQEFCEAESRARPVVLVLEDLHWADPATIRAVDGLLRVAASAPLYVVALARPEVEEIFPALWRERDLERIALAPLTRRAAESLAQSVLGEKADAGLVSRAVDLAAGNAFYLEEVLRAIAEGGEGALPETVLAMVQSRLDAQSLAARRLLRAASVFGGAFWVGGVRLLLGDDASSLDAALQELVARELVTVRSDSHFEGQRELTFRHAVVRDAAYATLPESDRKTGHLLAGQWLASVGETDAAVVAEHLELGGDRTAASGHWQRAAVQAMAGNDLDVVLAHLRRALACKPEAAQRGALLLLKAEAHRWRGELEEGEAAALASRAELAPGTPDYYQATAEAAVQASRRGNRPRAEALADSLFAFAPPAASRSSYLVALTRMAWLLVISGAGEAGQRAFVEIEAVEPHVVSDPIVAAHVALSRAHRARWADDALLAARLDGEAARHFTEAGDLRAACNQEMNVGFGHLALGRLEDAERALRDALHTAQTLGLAQIVATAEHNIGLVVAYRGRLDEAVAIETSSVNRFMSMGDKWYAAFALVYRSLIHALAGNFIEAARDAQDAFDRSTLAMQRVYALAALAQALVGLGKIDEAITRVDEAVAALPQRTGLDEVEALVRAVRREALEAAGRTEEASIAAREGREWIHGLAAKIADEPSRAAFLALPVHVRLTR